MAFTLEPALTMGEPERVPGGVEVVAAGPAGGRRGRA